jgi:hypothetical protein
MPFTMLLIVDILLGLLFGGFAHGITCLFNQGQTKWCNLALGFLMGAIFVGGIMCLAGYPRANDIYGFFWPLPVVSGLFGLTMSSSIWKGISDFLSGAGQYPADSAGFSNSYYGYDERRRYERDSERRYWGE